MIKSICSKIGVEIGEMWHGNDRGYYKITKDGELKSYIVHDKDSYELIKSDNLDSIIYGDLEPVWMPKEGETYYVPSIYDKMLEPVPLIWSGNHVDYFLLYRKLVFKSKNEARFVAENLLFDNIFYYNKNNEIYDIYKITKNKTVNINSLEDGFLELFYNMATIEEHLITHSKGEITAETCIEKISEVIKGLW